MNLILQLSYCSSSAFSIVWNVLEMFIVLYYIDVLHESSSSSLLPLPSSVTPSLFQFFKSYLFYHETQITADSKGRFGKFGAFGKEKSNPV